MDYIVELKGIDKSFSNKKVLDGLDLNIPRGKIYGLIGKNGSGKSTIYKIIAGIYKQDRGDIRLFSSSDLSNARSRMGFLIEDPAFYPNMTISQNLSMKMTALGIRRKSYIEDILERVNLKEEDRKAKDLPTGLKRKLGLAMALVGDPDLLLLDEPTNGIDPKGINDFRRAIFSMREEGNTIVISSHILGELSKYCDLFGIINEGRIISQISREDLMEKTRSRIVIVSPEIKKVVVYLEEALKLTNFKVMDKKTLYLYEGIEDSKYIARGLFDQGIFYEEFYLKGESLEDYYLELLGEENAERL